MGRGGMFLIPNRCRRITKHPENSQNRHKHTRLCAADSCHALTASLRPSGCSPRAGLPRTLNSKADHSPIFWFCSRQSTPRSLRMVSFSLVVLTVFCHRSRIRKTGRLWRIWLFGFRGWHHGPREWQIDKALRCYLENDANRRCALK